MNDTMETQDDLTIRTAIRAGEDTDLVGSTGGGNAVGGLIGSGT
jgi:hypothetical protein